MDRKHSYLLVIFLLVLQLFLLSNLQFTVWPEMLSYPYLRNNGFLIYKDMIHPYPPILTMGLSWIYAFFGYHLWVLQTVAWGIILSSSILVFIVTREVTKSKTSALISLALYVFLEPFLEGNMLWFDLAIVPSILLGLYFLIKNNLLLAGFFLAVATLTKQTAGLYLVFSILYLFFVKKVKFNQLSAVGESASGGKYIFYGLMILGIPLIVRLIQEGALSDFLNWVLVYPLTKWGSVIGYIQMELSLRDWLVIMLLFAPLIFIILRRQTILKDTTFQLLFLFLIGALVSVYPRFSFFHFQTAIALLAIIYGYMLSKTKITHLTIAQCLSRSAKLCLLPIAFIFILTHQPVISFDWGREARFYGQKDTEMAQIISSRVSKDERVYLLGLHSGLYPMSDRLPPKRWTDNFGWYLEIPGVQEEVIDRWQENTAKFIFWRIPSEGNPFDLGTYQPKKIVQWIEENYTKKEEVKPGIWLWVLRRAQD